MAASTGERWASRWGLLLAGIGMAVGTGNIWRFPRVAAKNGGGAFILVWLLALLVWSLPLLIMEMVLGRTTRRGPIGAFKAFLGPRWTWMGAWITWVTLAIMFYYSVVTGWCIRYFFFFAGRGLGAADDAGALWRQFSGDPARTIPFHMLAVGLACGIVVFGVTKGIERANRIMLPTLFGLLLLLAVRALTLDGAFQGVRYMFGVDVKALALPQTWIEGFSQSAWSTGAGWGLLLTYAVYTREREDIGQNCFVIGFGNNLASVAAGLAVLPTIFALVPREGLKDVLGAGNQGLTFIYLASLFPRMAGGRILGALFFLALVFAAMSSLVSMVEMGVRVLGDAGIRRQRAVAVIGVVGILFGLPSAISMDVFNNQDWVWGLGLLVSGLFIAIAAMAGGCDRIRREIINVEGNLLRIGRWWNVAIKVLIPVIFLVLTAWWLSSGVGWSKRPWWHPLGIYTVGTVLVQWALALVVFLFLNRRLSATNR
jgi:NSS family neurotransmitter:Na+ symporter